MLRLKSGESVKVAVSGKAPESGKHGAITLTKATLFRSDGTSVDKTPADAILREQGTAVNPAVEGTVQSAPSFSGGGGTGGMDIHSVALNTGEGASFSAGDYVRSKTAGKGAIYQIDTISTDTLNLFSAENEMDVANGDTIEKVTPEKWYRTSVDVSFADLNGLQCELEYQVDGETSSTRVLKPAISQAINERTREYVAPPSTPQT